MALVKKSIDLFKFSINSIEIEYDYNKIHFDHIRISYHYHHSVLSHCISCVTEHLFYGSCPNSVLVYYLFHSAWQPVHGSGAQTNQKMVSYTSVSVIEFKYNSCCITSANTCPTVLNTFQLINKHEQKNTCISFSTIRTSTPIAQHHNERPSPSTSVTIKVGHPEI